MEASRRPTLKDIAASVDVSRSTVSRALSGRGYVSPDVRRAIARAVDDLGYVPDRKARDLRRGSTRDIGVVVSNLRDTFYSELATSIETTLREREYHMILMTDGGVEATQAAVVESLASMRVAGVIMTPVSRVPVQRLRRHDIRIVQADRVVPGERTDAVVGGNERGARDATTHLLELGHRHIALLIDEVVWTTGRGRLRGYRRARQAWGLGADDELVAFAPGSVGEAADHVGSLLDAHSEVTAIVAANGLLAEAAFTRLQERRTRVPDDISLVAYDDVPWMSMVRPTITAVTQHTSAIGRACAELLVSSLEDDSARRPKVRTIAPSLLVRQSVRRVAD